VRGFARKSKKLRRWIAATHDHHDHKTLRLCRTSFFNHQHRRAHAGNHHYVWRSFHARFIYRVSVRDSPRIFCSSSDRFFAAFSFWLPAIAVD
jgi:hypothetical protein